jgi:hypothetical protein
VEESVRLTERQQELLAQLRRCEESGLGMKAFAEREGLKVPDLYTAKGVLRRKGALAGSVRQPRFARVQVESACERAEGLCRVRLPNGCWVELSSPADSEAWRALLSAVAALP